MSVKDKKGKPDVSLVPGLAIEEVAKVLEFGARKYGEFSWLEGMSVRDFDGAISRHLHQIRHGNYLDKESELNHFAHIACNALMALELLRQGKLERNEGFNSFY